MPPAMRQGDRKRARVWTRLGRFTRGGIGLRCMCKREKSLGGHEFYRLTCKQVLHPQRHPRHRRILLRLRSTLQNGACTFACSLPSLFSQVFLLTHKVSLSMFRSAKLQAGAANPSAPTPTPPKTSPTASNPSKAPNASASPSTPPSRTSCRGNSPRNSAKCACYQARRRWHFIRRRILVTKILLGWRRIV